MKNHLPAPPTCIMQEPDTKVKENTNNKHSCTSIVHDSTQPSTKEMVKVHSLFNTNINNMANISPSPTTSSIINSSDVQKMPVYQKSNKRPQSEYMVAINIPYDDSGIPTLVEDMDTQHC